MESRQKRVTKEQVRDLLAVGNTPRAIALELGVTTQDVYHHMETLKRENGKKAKK